MPKVASAAVSLNVAVELVMNIVGSFYLMENLP